MAPANQTKMHVALYCLWLLLIRIGQSVIQRAATACQESLSSMIYRRYVFTSVKITSRSGSSWSACVASLVGYSLLQVNRASFWMSSLLQHQPILFLCTVVKVDRRIRRHYTTTILRLRIGARLTRYRNCKFHNFARTISRHADGISRYSVPPSAALRTA